MKKSVTRLVGCLMVLTCLLSGCAGNSVTSEKEDKLLEPINVEKKTEKVTYREIFDLYTYTGKVEPAYVQLTFNGSGTFDQYTVSLGEEVKKGQVLAEQCDDEYNAELEQLQKDYNKLKKQAQDDKKLTSLNKQLLDIKIKKEKANLKKIDKAERKEIEYNLEKLEVSRKECVDTGALKNKENQTELSRIQTNIATLKKKIATNRIVAPYDGVVYATEEIAHGDNTSEQTLIVTLANTKKTYLIGQDMINDLGTSLHSTYTMIDGKKYELTEAPEEHQNAVEADRYDKKFVLKDKKTKIAMGISCLICQTSNYREHVLSLPIAAVYREGPSSYYVYKMNGDIREKVYVGVGVTTSLYTEITSGLQEGDVVYLE